MSLPLVIDAHKENKILAATCCLNDAQRNTLTVFLFPRNSVHEEGLLLYVTVASTSFNEDIQRIHLLPEVEITLVILSCS